MIGDRLKKLRGKRTQDSIANYLGISRARYSHYENNRTEPDIEMLKKLANFYSISLDALLENDAPHQDDGLQEIRKLSEEAGVESSGFFDLEQWKNLTIEERAQVIKYFEFIQMQSKGK